MNKYEIIKKIEEFAPLDLQEKWDCSGWLVETEKQEISKVMLALTVTENVIKQAKEQACDMIISHHPLFYIPFPSPLAGGATHVDNFENNLQIPSTGEGVRRTGEGLIDIYCAHTNLDKIKGGTTDELIRILGYGDQVIANESDATQHFVRYIDLKINIIDFIAKLKTISPSLRYINNYGVETLNRIAFCSGSGSEFIQESFESGADAFVTGDLKFHTALESPIVVFDIGHFESEIIVLPVFERVVGSDIEFVYAKETSPFKQTC